MKSPQSENVIIITAARPWLWFRETFNPLRHLKERQKVKTKEIDPITGLPKEVRPVGDTMDELRKVDDRIHQWAKDIDSIIRKVKSLKKSKAIDAGRLVDATQLLTQINNRLLWITEISAPLEEAHEKALKQFQEEVLEESPKIATAGFLSDFWEAVKREIMAESLISPEEKKKNEKRKRAVLQLIGHAETALKAVQDRLDKMEDARASANIGQYLTLLREVSVIQQRFESEFAAVYNQHLQPIAEEVVKKHEQQDQKADPRSIFEPPRPIELGDEDIEILDEEDEYEELGDEDIIEVEEDEIDVPLMPGVNKEAPQLDLELEMPGTTEEDLAIELDQDKPQKKTTRKKTTRKKRPAKKKTTKKKSPSKRKTKKKEPEKSPETLNREEMAKVREELMEQARNPDVELPEAPPEPIRLVPSTDLEKIVTQTKHQRFFEELVKASQTYHQPEILGAMLARYAQQISDEDPQTKLKLLAIVQGILDE